MRPVLNYVLPALLLVAASAQAQVPAASQTICTRSANLLACKDGLGNAYGVATEGKTIYLQGFEVIGKRYWAQTSSRYGQLTFFTGIASDGEAWVGYSRRVGWTTQNRFSSSGGLSKKFVCDRMVGC
ncbi:glutamine synthetase [Pseudomonas gingeri]|uniref:glutamine synthetase n=1 Tax=Pseudomonas gingeri TaxID=117681 RepID=UPI0015A4AAB6|nr:glutamine synthetase [Pseudomonas gingeri]NWA27428.1 glutamine synthetase [Pseudomonas gingeri]NWD69222.1 glutamine synthetase [Pseudomonas gingeri]NWD77064.1 glutamine synthetase [Pseudomonas gingeri]